VSTRGSLDNMQAPFSASTIALSDVRLDDDVRIVAATLVHEPARYFEMAATDRMIRLDRLVLSRARVDGVASAVGRMAEAFAGRIARRKAVTVRPLKDGRFLVVDGNSTTCIAYAAGWPEIPCAVLVDED